MKTTTEIVAEYGTHESDTGSPEVQVALLTERIRHLTEHFKIHKGGFFAEPGGDSNWACGASKIFMRSG